MKQISTVGIAARRRAAGRRAVLVAELPKTFIEAITSTRMDARHNHLNKLLKKQTSRRSKTAKRG
ncbi:MAG TPA: hypothetical protein VIM02_00740 [Rhizomicrobium sp.]